MHLSPAQRAYVRKHGTKPELDPSEVMGELNIVPLLDIIVNIIIFLLATVTYIVATVQIESNAPPIGRRGRSGNPNRSELNLFVTVGGNGIYVAGSGATLSPGCSGPAPTGTRSPTIAKVSRTRRGRRVNAYDFGALTRCAMRVKDQFPNESQVMVAADPTVEYQHLVAAMDALRANGGRRLFPQVLIATGVR